MPSKATVQVLPPSVDDLPHLPHRSASAFFDHVIRCTSIPGVGLARRALPAPSCRPANVPVEVQRVAALVDPRLRPRLRAPIVEVQAGAVAAAAPRSSARAAPQPVHHRLDAVGAGRLALPTVTFHVPSQKSNWRCSAAEQSGRAGRRGRPRRAPAASGRSPPLVRPRSRATRAVRGSCEASAGMLCRPRAARPGRSAHSRHRPADASSALIRSLDLAPAPLRHRRSRRDRVLVGRRVDHGQARAPFEVADDRRAELGIVRHADLDRRCRAAARPRRGAAPATGGGSGAATPCARGRRAAPSTSSARRAPRRGTARRGADGRPPCARRRARAVASSLTRS